MKKLILLMIFAFACQLVKGFNPPNPEASVVCKYNHTVSITIINVDDIDAWNTTEWRLQNNPECEPTFDGQTVNYNYLKLPDCAMNETQLDNSIKYVLKVNAVKRTGLDNGQLRAYDHMYYIWCEYDNQNRSMASFEPIVNRNDNASGSSAFHFSLHAFYYQNHTGAVPTPVALNIRIYFKAYVLTQSADPNLDLFLEQCWSSSSADPMSMENRLTLIEQGCGNNAVSDDLDDTLNYTCTNDSTREYFSLNTFRYFGQQAGSRVYIHCDMRVCLADVANTACQCPSVDECAPDTRKRRSLADQVDENVVYRVSSGPYIFERVEEPEEDVNEEEGEADEQDKPQSFSTNLVIIVAVSGVVALAICATVYFVVRSRNQRRQHGDLNVAT
ncbi:uncharacterized protein LOC144635104 [Oculina patagonica]